MTAYNAKGQAISQAVKILINGKEYTDKELRAIVKEYEKWKKSQT